MKDDKNSTQIFSLALGLDEPWFVESVSFVDVVETSTKELHKNYINMIFFTCAKLKFDYPKY